MKAIISALLTALLVVGCAPMQERAAQRPCDSNQRSASVTIESAGQITVSPEPIYVCQPGTKITWTINTSGFSFAGSGQGVVFGHPQFTCVAQGANQVMCVDAKSSSGKFKYTINVDGAGSLDPTVMND